MIYNEDCLEGMKRIPDKSVDMIATDPPYCVGVSSNGIKSSFADLNMLRPFWEQCFSEWRRILKDGGHVYSMTDWRTYPLVMPLFQKYFAMRNLIVWDIEWFKLGNYYRYSHELIMFGTAGKSERHFSNTEMDIWRIRFINYTLPAKRHQAEKPVELMEKMIRNSSREGDTVLDSFMGSGTTGVACVNLNRKFIGFELDEKYFEIAKKRIDDAVAQREQSLFR